MESPATMFCMPHGHHTTPTYWSEYAPTETKVVYDDLEVVRRSHSPKLRRNRSVQNVLSKSLLQGDFRDRIAKLLRVNLSCPAERKNIDEAKADPDWVTAFNNINWADGFTKEGYLQLDVIMSLVPPLHKESPATLRHSYRNFECAIRGLTYFNLNAKDCEYDLVEVLHSCLVPNDPKADFSSHLLHANFLAKPRCPFVSGEESKLFFTEMWACGDCHGKVRSCSIVDDTTTLPFELVRWPWIIYHPRDMVCQSCDPDDDESSRLNLKTTILPENVIYCNCKDVEDFQLQQVSYESSDDESETESEPPIIDESEYCTLWHADRNDFIKSANKSVESVKQRDGAAARVASLLYVRLDDIDGLNTGGQTVRVHQSWATKFLAIDWTACFDEDGYMLLDRIKENLSRLSVGSNPKLCYAYQGLELALEGLAHFNMVNEQEKYELVRVLSSNPIVCMDVSHANFIAEPRDGSGSPELFFTKAPFDLEWIVCEKVQPNPLLSPEFVARSGQIFHPAGEPCKMCDDAWCDDAWCDA